MGYFDCKLLGGHELRRDPRWEEVSVVMNGGGTVPSSKIFDFRAWRLRPIHENINENA